MVSNWPLNPSVTLVTSDTHHSRLHPQVRIGDTVAPLNRAPKILGVTLDTHFTFGPHARDCVEQASRALNVMKALAGSSWGFTTETLVAKYKAIVRPILNYAAPMWFTQVSSSHLDKLEVIQNKALRSYRSALSQLCSGQCSRLLSYSHSVRWADNPTCPECRSTTNHTVAHLFSCPTHRTDLAPGDIVDGTPPGRSIPGRASTIQ